MKCSLSRTVFLSALLVGCVEPSSPSLINLGDGEKSFGKVVADPNATVKLPLNDVGLSLKSDGKYSDGTYALYANGVCGITATIFLGGSGDMVMDGGNPRYSDRKCVSYPRRMTVIYPDGIQETIAGVLVSVNELESSTFLIPVGSSALRRFHVRTSSSRCDGVHWGGPVGGDSVLVTRTAADTWHVTTQAPPNDRAACKRTAGNTPLGSMPLDLWVVSSRNLP